MAKILVVTIGKPAGGQTRLQYKSFPIVDETKSAFKVRNANKSPLLDGKDLVRKNELEHVVFDGPIQGKAAILIDGEASQADVKALARQWYKVLQRQAMSRLRKQNLALKQMYKELEGLAI